MPEINMTDLLEVIGNANANANSGDNSGDGYGVDTNTSRGTEGFMSYITYPGISNCMTKMLNGIQCGDDINYNTVDMVKMVKNAKLALFSLAFVGVQEQYKLSLCLFSYLYGGTLDEYHILQQSRVGTYTPIVYEELEFELESVSDMDTESHITSSNPNTSTNVSNTSNNPNTLNVYNLSKEDYDLYLINEQYDIEVYNYAIQLFQERLSQTNLNQHI